MLKKYVVKQAYGVQLPRAEADVVQALPGQHGFGADALWRRKPLPALGMQLSKNRPCATSQGRQRAIGLVWWRFAGGAGGGGQVVCFAAAIGANVVEVKVGLSMGSQLGAQALIKRLVFCMASVSCLTTHWRLGS